MKLIVLNVYFIPNGNAVSLFVQDEDELGSPFFINLREDWLPAVWDNADVLAVAQARLDNPATAIDPDPVLRLRAQVVGKGHVLAFRDAPAAHLVAGV